MTASAFLWPSPDISRALRGTFRRISLESIEARLHEMFPSAHPIVVSSGRAGLALAIAHMQLVRADAVDIFPYASHCVLDAVGRRATPSLGAGAQAQARIVYHQWGYVQERQLGPRAIEDAVDSLCLPGSGLLPGGGRMELWSLPKILGTLGGGVIWFSDEAEAGAFRGLRDTSGARDSQWLMRLLGKAFPIAHFWWQGAETEFGRPSGFQLGEIDLALSSWDEIAHDRAAKLDVLWPLAPDWLPRPVARLPCAVPVEADERSVAMAEKLGFSAGPRHFVVSDHGEMRMVKLLPVPIHKDVAVESLETFAQRVSG